MGQPGNHGLLQGEERHDLLKIYFVLYHDFLIQTGHTDLALLHMDNTVVLSVLAKSVAGLGLFVYLGAEKFLKQPYSGGAAYLAS